MAPSPHDALFRYTFGKPAHAAGLLQALLPASVVAGVAWQTLQVVPGTQVDERLRRQQSDLAFLVRQAGRETFFYVLIEHKRRSDRWAMLQLLGYVVGLWRELRRRKPSSKRLPCVIPVLLIQQAVDGEPLNSLDCLIESGVSPELRKRQPQFRPFVARLDQFSMAQQRGLALTLEAKLTIEALHRLPGADVDVVAEVLRRWSGPVARLARSRSGGPVLQALWSYLVTVSDVPARALITIVEETMDPHVPRKFKPPIEQWRDEGRQEGRQEGRHEGREQGLREALLRMLQVRFGELPADVAGLVADASADQLHECLVRVLDAPTVQDIFRR